MSIAVDPTGTCLPGSPATANLNRTILRVDLFVDPACWWSCLTYRWLVQVAPLRHLDVRLRPYSLLLNAGPDGVEDREAALWGASLRALRVMQALDEQDPAGLPRFCQALIADRLAAFDAGRPPFADLEAALQGAGLPPGYAAAADEASFDEPIRRAMAEAAAAVGDGAGTPALVPHHDRPVGVLGPVISGPTTAAQAVRVWDAVEAFTAVPALLELSRPRPPMPEITAREMGSPFRQSSTVHPDRPTMQSADPERRWLTGAPLTTTQAETWRAGYNSDDDMTAASLGGDRSMPGQGDASTTVAPTRWGPLRCIAPLLIALITSALVLGSAAVIGPAAESSRGSPTPPACVTVGDPKGSPFTFSLSRRSTNQPRTAYITH